MITEGNGRRLRLGPPLAAQLIRRQRGRVELLDERDPAVGFRVRFSAGLPGEVPALREV